MPVLIPGIADSLHVRLFAAGSLVLKKWWIDTDHIRSMWRLCRADRSGAVLRYGDARFPLPAERLVLVPPGLKFEAHLERPVKELFVHFEVVGWPVPAVRDIFPEPFTLPPDPLRDQIAEELRKEIESADQLGPALSCRVKSLVHRVLASLEDALPGEKARLLRHMANGQLSLLEVLRFIDGRLHEPLDNARLAEIAHVSESCFIRRFRQAMGQTPAQYVQDRRVARATELLVCTEQSIDEVAQRCGFANRYYFSRVFTERVGRPPVRYRNERPVANNLLRKSG
jgi:AraC-like DNA-binding protein